MRQLAGFTIIEILIITAIAGIVLSIGAVNFRKALVDQQEKDGVNAIRRIIWQGTTLATSRNVEAHLIKDGHTLKIVDENAQILKEATLADSLRFENFGDGEVLTFLPSGRTELMSTSPIKVMTQQDSYTLNVSVIGDVRSVR